jgi:shikimate dehydrogenase
VPRAAVLGHPIAHSLSPVLHTAAYAALALTDWTYDVIDCDAPDLAALLAARQAPLWAGFSCTMPLKRVAIELAVAVEPLARDIGSANTLLPRAGGWYAATTDVAGIAAALTEHGVRPGQVTLLGAGGTAQAALGALVRLGVTECTALVRDLDRAALLRVSAERLGARVSVHDLDVDSPALDADLVISTLPAHAADPLAVRTWRGDQAVLDAVYHPWPTQLAAAAQRAGATVVSGALVLLYQAGEQVRLMTGEAAPLDAMRAALARAAPGCGV